MITVERRLEEAFGIELFGANLSSSVGATPESAAAAESMSAEAAGVGKNVAGVGMTTPRT